MTTEGITSVLVSLRDGRTGAFDKLVALVYPELRRIARRQLGRWRTGNSLDTGSLVNEAYLKLIDQTRVSWQDRQHFFAIAAHAMRQVMIDYARRRSSQKRGGGVKAAPLDTHEIAVQNQVEDLLLLDQLLSRLAAAEPRLLQIVECRYFAGYNEAETADALQISTRTVQREWLRAKAWLKAAATVRGRGGDPATPRTHPSTGR